MTISATLAGNIIATLTTVFLAAIGAAYSLFKFWGKKWLSSKFDEGLESYKHAQQKELEALRFKINALMDRTIKLHQHEFKVLPGIWGQLNEAFGYAMDAVSRLQAYPDLDRMGGAQFSEFLTKVELSQWEKDELQSCGKKTQTYSKMKFRYNLSRAEAKLRDFNNYFVKNSIFIQVEMKDQIWELRNMIWDALSERSIEEEYPNPSSGRFEKCDLLHKEGNERLLAIGEAVQNRLWNAQSLDQPERPLTSTLSA